MSISGPLLLGCAAERPPGDAGAGPASPISAMLRTTGPGVIVNGAEAGDGLAIRSGDRILTTGGASALVEFSEGTTVQLDEASQEVVLSWEGDSLNMSFDDTAAKVKKGKKNKSFRVVKVVGKMASFFSWSRFTVEENYPDRIRVDLFEGHQEFTAPPELKGTTLEGGQYLLLRKGAPVEIGAVTDPEAKRICARFERWRFFDDDSCEEIAALAPAFPLGIAPLLLGGLFVLVGGGGSSTTSTVSTN